MNIDHVAKFTDEAGAADALPSYRAGDGWDTSRVLAGVSIITADAVWDNTDPQNPVLVSPEQTLPGFWLAIGLPELSQDLIALPGNALRFAANRETGQIIYTAPDLNVALLASARVSPVFAGSQYQFGG